MIQKNICGVIISDWGSTSIYDLVEDSWEQHRKVKINHLWPSPYTAPEIINSPDDGEHEMMGGVSKAGDAFSFSRLVDQFFFCFDHFSNDAGHSVLNLNPDRDRTLLPDLNGRSQIILPG